jgi:hypothetical protein
MSSLVLTGDTSGQVTLAAPAVAGTNTLTLQAATATMSVNTLATAVSPTTSTSIEYTSLPSWIKKITLSFTALKSNGIASWWVQLGTSGSYVTTGYAGTYMYSNGTAAGVASGINTSSINIFHDTAANIRTGQVTLILVNSATNTWSATGFNGDTTTGYVFFTSSTISLAGSADRIRLITANGTDQYTAGTVNILYEG